MDREAQLAYWRAYNAAYRRDPEKQDARRAYRREYSRTHLASARQNVRQWRERYPEKAWVHSRVGAANTAAKRYGLPDRITSKEVLDLMARQPVCVACGHGRGLDHVVALSRGGRNSADNLQNLCHSCNSRKSQLVDRQRAAS